MPEQLRGQLPPFQLASLLQLIEADGLSGWLALAGGRIGFHDGRVVAAVHGGFSGRLALSALLMDADGAFAFHDDDPPEAGASLGSAAWMVMEAAQLADEWQRIAAKIVVSDGWTPDDPSVQLLIPELDGDVTLSEARQLAGLPIAAVLSPVEAALAAGTLREARPPDPERASKTVTPRELSFFDLLDEGRSLIREQRYRAAEAAFRRALMLRPDDRTAQQNLRRVCELATTTHP